MGAGYGAGSWDFSEPELVKEIYKNGSKEPGARSQVFFRGSQSQELGAGEKRYQLANTDSNEIASLIFRFCSIILSKFHTRYILTLAIHNHTFALYSLFLSIVQSFQISTAHLKLILPIRSNKSEHDSQI